MYRKRIVIGVTGASGIRLSRRLVEELNKKDVETYVIFTDAAEKVAIHEEGKDALEMIKRISSRFYMENEIDASIASSSYQTDGMVVIPCSMNTVAKIAHGISDNLLLRAVDNHIRMKRKLVIVPRETPVNTIHLENLLKLSMINTVYIVFPLLTYYHKPRNIEDMENLILGKIMDIFEIENQLYRRWRENE